MRAEISSSALCAPELQWREALAMWLDSRRSDNTRRAYQRAMDDLIRQSGKATWEIGRADVQRWLETMRSAGLSTATIQLRLAAVSSFYGFAAHDYTIVSESGKEQALFTRQNPAGGKSLRESLKPYARAICLSEHETRALLRAIPQRQAQGLRDYALILAYIATGRRNSEIRKLRWGDIQQSDGKIYYSWQGKGKGGRNELPAVVWAAIVRYLKASGRGSLADEDYIFTALNRRAARLGTVQDYDPYSRPLSMRMVGKLLKKYCRLAGLDAGRVHVHTLRHTAATLRRKVGEDVEAVSAFLGHANLGVTSRYLHSLDGKSDSSWAKVEVLLGLG